MDSLAIRRPVGATTERCDPAARITRSLLGYGVIAGPFYVAVALAQAVVRPGFDLSRHDVSLLANGSFGWVQVANFVVTGLMVVACAVGLSRAMSSGPAAKAAPRLLAVFGIGLIAAGIFTADPMNGFPLGTPAGMPGTISVHGLLHIAAAGVGFLCFIGACLAMARRFKVDGVDRWAAFSVLTGLVFLVAFAGLASGSSSAAVVLGFWAALLLAWSWLALMSIRAYRRIGRGISL
jgi:Protein of unknown function (DUF998)